MRGMNVEASSGRPTGNAGASRGGLHKGRACLFVVLVAIAVLCVCFLIYTLFYSGPRSGSPIHTPGQSLLRNSGPPFRAHTAVHS
jgi:hypothetical protein